MKKRLLIYLLFLVVVSPLFVSCRPVPEYLMQESNKNTQPLSNNEDPNQVPDTVNIRNEMVRINEKNDIYDLNKSLNIYEVEPYKFTSQRINEIVKCFWDNNEKLYDEMMNPVDYSESLENIESIESLALYKSQEEAIYFFLDSGSCTYINEELGQIVINSNNISENDKPRGCNITKDDAIDSATNLLKNLNINNYKFNEIIPYNSVESGDAYNHTVGFYMLSYVKSIDDINVSFDGLTKFSGQEVRISPDNIVILVNDNGIVQFNATMYNYLTLETYVGIISLNRALNVISQYLSKGNLVPPNTIDSITVNRTPEYLYIPKRGNDLFIKNYEAIPVWSMIISIRTDQGIQDRNVFINSITEDIYIN